MLNLQFKKVWQLPQTHILLLSIFFAYCSLIFFLGLRLFVLLCGGVIAITSIIRWFILQQPQKHKINYNLLETEVFTTRLEAISKNLANIDSDLWDWQDAIFYSKNSQQLAAKISLKRPELSGDLLDVLYSILIICDRVKNSIVAIESVNTESYKNEIKNKLFLDLEKLVCTHKQMQIMCDRVLVASLNDVSILEELPSQLQVLVDENQVVSG